MSLAEVLVATAVLAGLLAVSVGILQSGLRESRRQKFRSQAWFLAQGQLEKLMGEPELQPSSGRCSPPFEEYGWKLSLRPIEEGMIYLEVEVEGPAGTRVAVSTQRRESLRRLWFARAESGRSQLYRVSEDGSELEPVLASRFSDWQPAIAPDGTVAFVSDRAGAPRIYLAHADGPAVALDSSGAPQQEPAWSADGRFLAYTSQMQIYVWDRHSARSRVVSGSGARDSGPAWSPDGKLGFVSSMGGETALMLMDRDGRNRRELARFSGWCGPPSFSADGRQIVFMVNQDGNPEVYSMDRSGGRPRRLTTDPGYDTAPRFSLDGRMVVFSSDRDGGPGLYVMQPNGQRVRPLVPSGDGPVRDGCWQP